MAMSSLHPFALVLNPSYNKNGYLFRPFERIQNATQLFSSAILVKVLNLDLSITTWFLSLCDNFNLGARFPSASDGNILPITHTLSTLFAVATTWICRKAVCFFSSFMPIKPALLSEANPGSYYHCRMCIKCNCMYATVAEMNAKEPTPTILYTNYHIQIHV